jgi:hypothetical protein
MRTKSMQEGTMGNGHTLGIRPPSFLRVEERAADAVAAMTLYASIPSARGTFWRKARCRKEQPSPFTRVLGYLAELAGYGTPEPVLRRYEHAVRELIDDLFTGNDRPRIDVTTMQREVDLEHAENSLALRYAAGDRERTTLVAYADALEAEALHQLTMVRALRWDVRALSRTEAR